MVIQEKDNHVWDLDVSGGVDKYDFGYIPKVEPLAFSGKLYSKCKRKRWVTMIPSILVWETGGMESTPYRNGEGIWN